MAVVATTEELDAMPPGSTIQVQDRQWTRNIGGWVTAENPGVPVRSAVFHGFVKAGGVIVGGAIAVGQWWVNASTSESLLVMQFDEGADMATVLVCRAGVPPVETRKRPRTIRLRYQLSGTQVPTVVVSQELTQFLVDRMVSQAQAVSEVQAAATQAVEAERLQLKRNQERQTQMETFVAGVTRSLEDMSTHIATALRTIQS